jgi:hypothetical protein
MSLPLNKSQNLLRMEWAPVYHIKGWGKFNGHYGDFCTGADTLAYFDSLGLPRLFVGLAYFASLGIPQLFGKP